MQERKYNTDSEIQFFENDIVDKQSYTRYLSMVLLWIKNSQVRKNLQGIFALLFASALLFGTVYMIVGPSEKEIVLRSVYAKTSKPLTTEKVTNFFKNQKEFHTKSVEKHIFLQNSLTPKELEQVGNYFTRNFSYNILEANISSNSSKELFLLQQILNSEIINTLDEDDLEFFNILIVLIEQNNFEASQLSGNKMLEIIKSNKIMQNILDSRSQETPTPEEIISKTKTTHKA